MRRRIGIAAAVVLLVAVASLGVRFFLPEARFVYGVVAAGEDEALLLTRRNEDHGTSFWIERVGLDGRLRWSFETTPLAASDALGHSGVAADDSRVIVLARDGEREFALALDRKAGRRVWQTALPGDRPTGRIGPMVMIDGPRVYLVRETDAGQGPTERIDALALEDGALLWTFAPETGIDLHVLAPGRLLVGLRGGGGRVLDGTSGAVSQTIELSRVICTIAEGALASARGQAMLVPAAADRPIWRIEAEQSWYASDGPCGARGEDPVLVARRGSDGAMMLVRVDRGSGRPRFQTELGAGNVEPLVSLDGRLPRFLPVAGFGSDEGGAIRQEFAVFDLEDGSEVRRAAIRDHVEVVATPERAWLWLPFKGLLVGLDPATGAIERASAVQGLGTSHARREDLRFGSLWLHGYGWARPEALPWAAVDLRSGEFLRLNGIASARDATAEARASLGGS